MLKVKNTASFLLEIERLVKEESFGYIEAITQYCQETGIDMESIPKLLTANLKSKIKNEAIELNLINRGKKPQKLSFE